MRQTFEEAVYSVLHLLPPDEQKETYDRFVYESGRAACEIGYWFLDPKKAAKVDASKVTCPVLVIAGGKDRIVPASISRRVAKKYKSVSTYQEFKDHAHWVVAEPGWQDVAEYTAGWLEQVLAQKVS
jgi:pimeloyl-ACP methyl ester carboxylesterase